MTAWHHRRTGGSATSSRTHPVASADPIARLRQVVALVLVAVAAVACGGASTPTSAPARDASIPTVSTASPGTRPGTASGGPEAPSTSTDAAPVSDSTTTSASVTPTTSLGAAPSTIDRASSTTGPPRGAVADGAVGAADCPPIGALDAAFRASLAGTVDPGLGLEALRCTDEWVTAWTVPNPVTDLDPAVVLFHRRGDSWEAVAGGLSNQCLDRVPSRLWSSLDCF